MQLQGNDSRFYRGHQQEPPDFIGVQAGPMGKHQQHQQLTRRVQSQRQQQHPPLGIISTERDDFSAPRDHDRIVKSSAPGDSSNDDDGETSSASEDSMAAAATAGYKRALEPSPSFGFPPPQRCRTTASGAGHSGGTLEQQLQRPQQQQQLPRFAALETLLSSHTRQQQEQRQQAPRPTFFSFDHRHGHHYQQEQQQHGYPESPLAPTPKILLPTRSNAAPMQLLPPLSLSRATGSRGSPASSLSPPTTSPPSPTGGSGTSSPMALSPACSPGLRASSPPYGLAAAIGRYQLQAPAPATCVKSASLSAGLFAGGSYRSANLNQRHHMPPSRSGASSSSDGELRRRMPRIDGLSPSNPTVPSGKPEQQPYHSSAPAQAVEEASGIAAATSPCWFKPSGRGGAFPQTTVPYSSYSAGGVAAGCGRDFGGDRGSNWMGQQAAREPWLQQRRQGLEQRCHHQHDQQKVMIPDTVPVSVAPSRTPSPSPFRQAQEPGVARHQQEQQHHARTTLSVTARGFPQASTLPLERVVPAGKSKSWSPTTLDGDGGRSAPPSLARGSSGASSSGGGKWDENNEAQARASGISVGKQILQRYLTNLYPKASREVWSHDEEEVLWRAQKEYGNAWSFISSLLPGRSENAVKNHWYTQMRMFIGQRSNNASGSKPCHLTSPHWEASATSNPAGQGGSGRHHKPRQQVQQQQQQRRASPPGSTTAGWTGAEGAAAAAVTAAAAAAVADPLLKISAPEPATFGAKAAAEPSFEIETEKKNNKREENQARADAVAALGMLFSQASASSSSASGAVPSAEAVGRR